MTVTAQKQEENIREIPVSASVLDSIDIEDRGIESISQVADFVPNFMIFYNGNAGMNSRAKCSFPAGDCSPSRQVTA